MGKIHDIVDKGQQTYQGENNFAVKNFIFKKTSSINLTVESKGMQYQLTFVEQVQEISADTKYNRAVQQILAQKRLK